MNKKYIIASGFALSMFVAVGIAQAEDANQGGSGPRPAPINFNQPGRPTMDPSMREKMLQQRKGENAPLKNDITDMRKNIMEDRAKIQGEKKDFRGVIQQGREEIKGLREGMTPENRDDIKNQIKDKRAEMQGARQEMRDDIKEKRGEIKEKRKDIKEVRHEIMQNRFKAMVERLTTLGTRIDSRLTKIEASGKDVTDLRAKLTTAQAKIAEAQAKVNTITSTGDTSVEPTTGAGATDANKATIEEVKTLMKEAQSLFGEIVNAIKVEPKKEVTSTK